MSKVKQIITLRENGVGLQTITKSVGIASNTVKKYPKLIQNKRLQLPGFTCPGRCQLTYVEAIPSQNKEDYIGASENVFHYFGGVSRVLVPDNLKSAVDKASKYEAELNSDFADFANHYNTAVLPTRSYKPRDKALVENAIIIIYSRIYTPLRNRVFFSLKELNQAIGNLSICSFNFSFLIIFFFITIYRNN